MGKVGIKTGLTVCLHFNNTPIGFAVMDGDITVTGSQGLQADFSITNFSRNEALEEAITVSVTEETDLFDGGAGLGGHSVEGLGGRSEASCLIIRMSWFWGEMASCLYTQTEKTTRIER